MKAEGTKSLLQYFIKAAHIILKACKLTCFCESHSSASCFDRLIKKEGTFCRNLQALGPGDWNIRGNTVYILWKETGPYMSSCILLMIKGMQQNKLLSIGLSSWNREMKTQLVVIVSKPTASWEHNIVQVSLPPGILLSYTVFTWCHLKGKEWWMVS